MSGALRQPLASQGQLLVEVREGVATVTLNRPEVLNALSFGMLAGLSGLLDDWETNDGVRTIVLRGAGDRAFCAGGDMRALRQALKAGDNAYRDYFRVEYTLDYRIHTFPKPIVAVIDGIVMGGGMGLSQGAALRTVGGRTLMAMPETGIGVFPDVGGSYFLTRTPGWIGCYLGLTGATLDAADALYAGLADEFVPGYISGGKSNLVRVQEQSQLAMLRPAIDRHFSAGSVKEIIASLEGERETQFRPWAAQTASTLRKRSPTMLEVTFEALRRGARMTLAQCLRMELGLMHACFEHNDLTEGIRALLVDKDSRPRWSPATLDGVSREVVARFFAPRWPEHDHPLAQLEKRHGAK